MMGLNRKLPSVKNNQYAMVAKTDVPRSTFLTEFTVKDTIDAGVVYPFHVDEVLPGDHHRGSVQIFARLQTSVFPPMDGGDIETFYFFVPARLVWQNWERFMGQQDNPSDSISYLIPQVQSANGGFAINSIYDHFGIPCAGQVLPGNPITVNALPLRCYNLIWTEWFRDQDLQSSLPLPLGDGPDAVNTYGLQPRNKKADMFTSARPWPLKGGVQPSLPISGIINVQPLNNAVGPMFKKGAGPLPTGQLQAGSTGTPTMSIQAGNTAAWVVGDVLNWSSPNLTVDLSTAQGSTVNAMRNTMAIQQLLERNARSGTRYTEQLQADWGVHPDDGRMQRPEYIGGGRSRLQSQAMPQTSPNSGSNYMGSLAGAAIVNDNHSFSYHATEHGYIIGLINLSLDVTYQQGLPRMWTRKTRYDFYNPVFANLGERAIRNDELYADGSANDTLTFGYNENWCEYRTYTSRICGQFRSRSAGTIDPWHYAQNFATLPALNATFIIQPNTLARSLSAGVAAANMQLIVDSYWQLRRTRALPMFSDPGLKRF